MKEVGTTGYVQGTWLIIHHSLYTFRSTTMGYLEIQLRKWIVSETRRSKGNVHIAGQDEQTDAQSKHT